MNVYKFFTNFDEEENWLNGMARQGYRLVKKGSFSYSFEPCEPENATIKVDYRSFKTWADYEDYVMLFADSGWQHIAGKKSSGYQYFKKMAPFGSDEIFSDNDSRAGRYKRLSEMWAALALTLFPVLVALISTDTIDAGVWLNPKALYYTQGLWEMHGAAFWKALLFETPFALFRGGIWAILPAAIVIYMYCAWKANQQYTLAQKNKIIH